MTPQPTTLNASGCPSKRTVREAHRHGLLDNDNYRDHLSASKDAGGSDSDGPPSPAGSDSDGPPPLTNTSAITGARACEETPPDSYYMNGPCRHVTTPKHSGAHGWQREDAEPTHTQYIRSPMIVHCALVCGPYCESPVRHVFRKRSRKAALIPGTKTQHHRKACTVECLPFGPVFVAGKWSQKSSLVFL